MPVGLRTSVVAFLHSHVQAGSLVTRPAIDSCHVMIHRDGRCNLPYLDPHTGDVLCLEKILIT